MLVALLGAAVSVPLKVAVIACMPGLSEVVVNDARPSTSSFTASTVSPSVIVTVPPSDGGTAAERRNPIGPLPPSEVTWTVNVTGCPASDGFAELVMRVVVARRAVGAEVAVVGGVVGAAVGSVIVAEGVDVGDAAGSVVSGVEVPGVEVPGADVSGADVSGAGWDVDVVDVEEPGVVATVVVVDVGGSPTCWSSSAVLSSVPGNE